MVVAFNRAESRQLADLPEPPMADCRQHKHQESSQWCQTLHGENLEPAGVVGLVLARGIAKHVADTVSRIVAQCLACDVVGAWRQDAAITATGIHVIPWEIKVGRVLYRQRRVRGTASL